MRLTNLAALAALALTSAADASGPPPPKPGTSFIRPIFRPHQPLPPPPDDSNTCVPTPPTCTGQWCTSCTDGYCLDIDGPGASASLCGGDLSWCTEADCGASPLQLRDLAVLQGTLGLCEFETYKSGCTLTCDGVSVGCSTRTHGSGVDSLCTLSSGEQFTVHHNVCR